MDGWISKWMYAMVGYEMVYPYGWIDIEMDRWMDGWMDGWMDR